jgi:maleate isomerase/arylmalonate decarboxylase
MMLNSDRRKFIVTASMTAATSILSSNKASAVDGRELTRQEARSIARSFLPPAYQLGYIIPHRYTDMDSYQFYRVAPDGMMLVTTGLDLSEYSLDSVESQLPPFYSALDLLKKKRVDRIALSGVPIAAAMGRSRMLAMLEEASERTGIECDTDLEAHIAAMKRMGIKRLAIGSRWSNEVNTALAEYLASAGIEVVACVAQGRSLAVNKLANAKSDHDLALALGREVLASAPNAQGLLLPGGLWYAIYAVPILEQEFGKPVFLNVLSTTSNAMHTKLFKEKMQGFGKTDPYWGKVLSS